MEDSFLEDLDDSLAIYILISARKRRNKKRAIWLKKMAVEKDTVHPYKYFERTSAIPRRFQQLPEDG